MRFRAVLLVLLAACTSSQRQYEGNFGLLGVAPRIRTMLQATAARIEAEAGTRSSPLSLIGSPSPQSVLKTHLHEPYMFDAILREQNEVERAQRRQPDHDNHDLGAPAMSRDNIVCRRHSECNADSFCSAGTHVCKECRFCTSNGVAVDGRCPLECASAASSGGPDTNPPELGWAFVDNRLELMGNTVYLTKPNERVWLDLYMYVKDTGSGVKGAALFYTSTTLSGETYGIKVVANAARDMTSSTSEGGVLRASFWFEFADEAGRWGLRQLQLEDYAGNLRVYSEQDFLLFGTKVNTTLEVVGSLDRYVMCRHATRLRCDRNAICFDQCHTSGAQGCFGKCSCKPGYSGNEFTCMKSELLAQHRENGTIPTGLVILAEDYLGESTSIPQDELAGRDSSGGSQSEGESREWPSNTNYGKAFPESETNSCLSDIYCTGALSIGLAFALACCLLLMRCRVVLIDTVCAFLLQRRRSRRRTVPSLDSEDLRSIHLQRPLHFQAWTHHSDGQSVVARNDRASRQTHASAQEAELIAWATSLSYADMGPGRRGDGMAVSQAGVRRDGSRRLYSPPQQPAAVSLPAHLLEAKMPGEVPEEVAEGQECAVCMERKQDTKLLPCGHTDLCFGCAEHIYKHKGLCPVCRPSKDADFLKDSSSPCPPVSDEIEAEASLIKRERRDTRKSRQESERYQKRLQWYDVSLVRLETWNFYLLTGLLANKDCGRLHDPAELERLRDSLSDDGPEARRTAWQTISEEDAAYAACIKPRS